MKYKILLLFLFPTFLFAQTKTNLGRTYSDTLPEAFSLNSATLRNHIFQRTPHHIREISYPRTTFKFADQASLQTSWKFGEGEVYSDWKSLEDYVNQVFQKVMPEEFRKDDFIKAYILRKGSFNASMTPSGYAFINIGLFGEIRDEATLAAILVHELAHYHLHHSLKTFVKAEAKDFKYGVFSKRNTANAYSVKNELQADSLAMVWLHKSGYHINGLLEAFKINSRHEENEIALSGRYFEVETTTHPSSEERETQLDEFLQKNKENLGQFYLVDQIAFHQFRKEAKPEILQLLLKDFEYYSCLEKAFTYHLYEPKNATYIYYIMEATRRICYFNPNIWLDNFITNRYYKVVGRNILTRHKKKWEEPIFESFPSTFLGLDPNAIFEIKTKSYWEGTQKFKTFEEAYLFYSKLGKALKEPECTLSQALTFSFDKKISNQYLKEYLNYEDIKYRDFAKNLLADSIKTSLPSKRLLVFSGFSAYVKQGKESILVRRKKSDAYSQLKRIFEGVQSEFPDMAPLFISDLQRNKINDYRLFLELERFANLTFFRKGEKLKLHILDPRYWEIMNKWAVNEIDFINCAYYDVRDAEISLDSYKEVLKIDYDQLFSEAKRYRYLDIFVSSVREIEGQIIRINYNLGDEQLYYKKPVQEQIVKIIRKKIKEKDDWLKDHGKSIEEK